MSSAADLSSCMDVVLWIRWYQERANMQCKCILCACISANKLMGTDHPQERGSTADASDLSVLAPRFEHQGLMNLFSSRQWLYIVSICILCVYQFLIKKAYRPQRRGSAADLEVVDRLQGYLAHKKISTPLGPS